MPTVAIKPDHKAISAYYATLDNLREGQDVAHEGAVRRAFSHLLEETAKVRSWTLVEELGRKSSKTTKQVYPDGTLRDQWRLPHGYWEAKDTHDDLDTEIRKKRERGYPFDNIIFEDSDAAVLFQDGLESLRVRLRDADGLAKLLTHFYNYDIAPFSEFNEAVDYFKTEIPAIARGLQEKIGSAHKDNRKFQAAFTVFMELCRSALNPNISQPAVDEMLIQHLLTERIIRKVFDMETFTRRNVIASEVENVIDALTSQHFNRAEFLGALDRFYTAIENAADRLADFTDKQHFINTVYERFFQGYSVKIADTHGIVYTPQEIVDFMCAAVEEVLHDEFGVKLGDDGVCLIDPCTGTGNFIVNLLRRAHTSNPRNFDRFYREQLFANEVMLMPYYIASLNIEHEYYALTGRYEEFEGVCFVDTLDLAEGPQMRMAFMTEKNSARVERQKQAPITVIIGNPPYNANQQNENDNNKNRKYEVIEERVRETYAKDSTATNKNQLSDPYVKFFRWATDRLDNRDGVVCFVSNNSFIDSIAFDGMRKHLQQDFQQIYLVDLKGNVRKDSMREGIPIGEKNTVFGLAAMVGISVAVLVRKQTYDETKIHYATVDWKSTREEKFDWLRSVKTPKGIDWQELQPDNKNTWLVPENADEFEGYLPIGSKETKSLKSENVETIFKAYGRGVATTRDNVVYDYESELLIERVKSFIEIYNAEVDRYKRSGKPKDVDGFVSYDKIKWSRDLKLDLQRGNYAEYNDSKLRSSIYRPFCKKHLFFDRILNEEVYVFPSIFPTPATEQENRVICIGGYGRKEFAIFASNLIPDLNFYADPAQCFPFYVYDEDGSNRRENITDWALAQFRERYGGPQPPGPLLPQVEGGAKTGAPQHASHSDFNSPRPEGEGLGVRANDMRAKDLTPDFNSPRPEGEGLGVRANDMRAKDLTPDFNSPRSEGEGLGVRANDMRAKDLTPDFNSPRPEGEGLGVRANDMRAETEKYRAMASSAMVQISRDLRQRQTPAETTLWECLRSRRLGGLKFRRQHPIANTAYVVDFFCYEAKLIVELDGGIHAGQVEEDAVRQANLEALGYNAVRFKNNDVQTQLEDVLTYILLAAHTNSPRPEGEGLGVRANNAPEDDGLGVRANNAPEDDGLGVRANNAPEDDRLGVRANNAPEDDGLGVRANNAPEDDGLGVRANDLRTITKWDIFYYVYGLLHHPEYRARYADNLKRELPRIPFASDFWAFSDAGKKLADLHLNYESVKPYELQWVTKSDTPISYRVEKMRLSKDKTALVVNDTLTMMGIPPQALDYRLGNRSALEWVIDQYQVSTDTRSGITSDPNGYSEDERYIVDLVEKVIRVSVDTVAIVNELAKLPFRETSE